MKAKLNLPDTLTVGLTQSILPNLRLNLSVEWANWSRLGNPAIVSQFTFPGLALAGAAITSLPLNYKDGYFYSAGLEYDWGPQLSLRAGVAYEESPITDVIRSTRLPDNDRIWASIGATYRWNHKLSFDVAYTHIFVMDTPIRIVPGHQDFIATPAALGGLPFVGDADARVDIFSVWLNTAGTTRRCRSPRRSCARAEAYKRRRTRNGRAGGNAGPFRYGAVIPRGREAESPEPISADPGRRR